jgi:hypothetical protein|tara:strand:- start:710 stop:955 length:246 start_codon:yes stop_codon:yes gene_type:complete
MLTLCSIENGREVGMMHMLKDLRRWLMHKLEQEAKKFMQGKNNTFSKKLDELVENTRLLKNLSEVILRKAKELNAKNNTDT